MHVDVVEVCGFNDWLLKLLPEYGCKEVVLVQPEERDRWKTDRRDAHRLGELLWINRERLLAGQRVQGLRRVFIPSTDELHDRQLTQLRKRLGASRTRLITMECIGVQSQTTRTPAIGPAETNRERQRLSRLGQTETSHRTHKSLSHY